MFELPRGRSRSLEAKRRPVLSERSGVRSPEVRLRPLGCAQDGVQAPEVQSAVQSRGDSQTEKTVFGFFGSRFWSGLLQAAHV